jgi:hypothetical protein
MEALEKKWGLLVWPCIITVVVILARFVIGYCGFAVVPINALLGALVTGVVFTIAMILTGTLSDYKESERVPSDMVAAFKALWQDSFLLEGSDNYNMNARANPFRRSLFNLWDTISANLQGGEWNIKSISSSIIDLNNEIVALNVAKAPINIVIKMRQELGNIDKICHRILQIKDTDFIPAAYAIAESAIGFMLLVLTFVKSDTMFDSVGIAVLTFLVISLLMLIKDMDDPFEAPGEGFADVDMFQIYNLKDYLTQEVMTAEVNR